MMMMMNTPGKEASGGTVDGTAFQSRQLKEMLKKLTLDVSWGLLRDRIKMELWNDIITQS